MATLIRRLWNEAFWRPASARTLSMTRVVLALQALWILLSRPDLPSFAGWPRAFFSDAHRIEFLRFGVVHGGVPIEWALYIGLHVFLLLAAAGIKSRATCAASGLLLYHFAPFEEIIAGMPHTHFGGLTISCTGLLILSFAQQPSPNGDEQSTEYRWPVTLIQLLFTFIYLFAFFGKLRYGHIGWFTASNIRMYALYAWIMTGTRIGWWIAQSALLCWVIAIATLLFEPLSPLAVFSRTFRRLWIPAAIAFHIGVLLMLRIHYTSLPLLLLFTNWDALRARLTRPKSADAASATAGGAPPSPA